MTHALLYSHPTTPCRTVRRLGVNCDYTPRGRLSLSYHLAGSLGDILIPPRKTDAARRDELWQHTCFELFLQGRDESAYWEFNFSPSGEWAIYRFDRYRSGMSLPESEFKPLIRLTQKADTLWLNVMVDLSLTDLAIDAETPVRLGISAVIESAEGEISYWALHHPSEKPDFHHTGSFALPLVI